MSEERPSMTPSPKVGRRRWTIGVLLGVGILINYFDRVNISVAAPQLQQGVPPDADRPRPAVQRLLLVLRHSPGSGRHDPRPVRSDERQPDRRVPVGRRVGPGRLRHRLRHDFRRARPARRRRGPGLPGQFQGDRLLVPARRARLGDGDFRRRGQILQRHRRAAGRLRRGRIRLAMGLRPDGRA